MNMHDITANDFRLFPNDLMYCEGRFKPFARGLFHAIGVTLLCPIWASNISLSIDNYNESMAWIIFFSGILACWIISALFHCFKWSLKDEIFLQKLGSSIDISFI